MLAASLNAFNSSAQLVTVAGVLLSGLSFLGLVRYGSRFLKSENIKAQMHEKDEIIKTHEQNIDALEKRLSIFEDEIKALTAQVDAASSQIAHLQSKLEASIQSYKKLEKYAAPSALDLLNTRFDKQEDLLQRLVINADPKKHG